MLERNILIIDDNTLIKDIYVPDYLSKINSLKNKSGKWANYEFRIEHCSGMAAALEFLGNAGNIIDVLVVDYDFSAESNSPFPNGTVFVKYIRENVNRHCEIIFYTMQGLSSIDVEDWASLVNSDVFKFVDKSEESGVFCEAIFEAATKRNPIVESLERFWIKYEALLKAYTYTFNGQAVPFQDIINHIRMDDELGRMFVEKLLQKSILMNTEI